MQIGCSIYANPIYANPIYANPIYANPIYANPIHANPIHANPIHANPIQQDTMKKKSRYRKFGLLVYKRRHEMQLSQEQLAELLDISVQQVRNYESGRSRPSVERLFDLSRKMNVTVECLMLSVSEEA